MNQPTTIAPLASPATLAPFPVPSSYAGRRSYEAARDRRRASLDNIQKMLDVIRSIEPQV